MGKNIAVKAALAGILVIAVLELCLLVFAYDRYLWVIPIVLLINLLGFWLIVNQLVIRVMLFPFSIKFIKDWDERKLNQ